MKRWHIILSGSILLIAISSVALFLGYSPFNSQTVNPDITSPPNTDLENSQDATFYNNRANANFSAGRYQEAIADYNQAIKLNPNLATAYYNRGFAQYKLLKEKEALADYNKALELNPNYIEAYGNRGVVRAQLGDYPGAISDYTKVLESYPQLASMYYNRGVAYYNNQNPEKAVKDLEEARRLFQESGDLEIVNEIATALSKIK